MDEHEPYRRPPIGIPPVPPGDNIVRSVATGLPVLRREAGDAEAVMQAATDILEEKVDEGDGMHLELLEDPGWWRVTWPQSAETRRGPVVTHFRSRDEAVTLQEALRGSTAHVEWVQELPCSKP